MDHTMNRTVMDDDLLGPSPFSAVAWPAVFAGAFTAAVISLALAVLGSGLGLAAISPWASPGESNAVEYTVTAMIWVVIMQWASSAFGGYLAGRLRTQATGLHSSEVLFRDTAHGFLAWAVATLLTAAFLTSTLSSIVKGGTDAATTIAAASVSGEDSAAGGVSTDPISYYMDDLLRGGTPGATGDARAEAARIVIRGVQEGGFTEADRNTLAQIIARQTGLSNVEATQRVDAMIAAADEARQAADDARKAAATFSVLSFLSLLIGAFIAAVSAGVGGKHRDYRPL